MGFSLGSLLKPVESAGSALLNGASHLLHPGAPSAPAHAPDGATAAGAAAGAAAGLGAGSTTSGGPRLSSLWNTLMGGPGTEAGDGRSLSTNHIGNKFGGGPLGENGPMSTAMRNTPYLGDYWEALAVTHDSEHIHPALLNGLTAVTNVGLTGPLMGLVDAPFRAFGHSLFLDNDGK